ncbi:tyrosine-type recombinase/integrase [Paraburkholderia fungorum]|uniref:tyrosine-type recombinase/integrase n=1 Tax=Paraburkholderia fungorum TaxID=134537 RepID=UPI001C1EFDE5|nr:site-specific integrase [Paraburkholderia fungorum]MBU7436479.1 tyrosine-type recombinase/integrase [Paraburkholderia fungorum]
MSIRKRKGSDVWHIDIRAPGGGRIRQTTGTADKKEAQELHDKLKHEAWRVAKMGERPRYVFEHAAARYLTEQANKADYDDRAAHIRHFLTHFAGRDLGSITRPEIMAAIPTQSARKCRKTPLKPATRNRYLATIRALMLDAANDWEWIDRAPSLPEFPEPAIRIRWIARDEAKRLLRELDEACMRDIAAFCFATGLRQRNILELEWTQVDLVSRRAWIHPDQAKARKPIGVPLNDEAIALLRKQIGQHDNFVFVRDGKPLKKWDDWKWRAACKRANISNFRFHDVRHTWASWHVQNGTPLQVLKELGGWATFEMVLRYAHLAPDHLAHHASAVLLQEPARLVAVK